MFPATLFDYNGVLANDETVHLDAFREVLAPLGVTVTDHDYVERYLGFDDFGAFRAMLADAGQPASEARIRELIAEKKPRYLKRAETSLPVFPGAAELVRRRASAGPVAIVSGALRDEIELGLRVLGVRDVVEAIIAAEDTTACKPDPEGYELGVKALTALAGESVARRALVIEDSIAGIQAAKAAGLTCVGVAHTYSAEELRAAGADGVVARVGEIEDDWLATLYRSIHA